MESGDDKSEDDPANRRRDDLKEGKGNRPRSRSLRRKRHHEDIIPKVKFLESTVSELLSNIDNLDRITERTVNEKVNAALESLTTKMTDMIGYTITSKLPELLKTFFNDNSHNSAEGSTHIANPTSAPDTPQTTSQDAYTTHPKPTRNSQPSNNIQSMDWTKTPFSKGKKPINNEAFHNPHIRQNNFELLNSLESEDASLKPESVNVEDINIKDNPFKKPRIEKKNHHTKTNSEKYDPSNKTFKATPIITYNINQKTVKNKLNELNMKDFRFLRSKDPNRVVILPSSKETRTAALSILSEKKINHYTFTPQDERNTTLIIKNIPTEYEIDDVSEELENMGVNNRIAKISKISTPRLEKYNLYALHIPPGEQIGEFLKINWMFNTRVKIEKFLRRDDPQCFKCQRLGHFSSGCEMEVKCVKCAQGHPSNECTLNKDSSKELLKCVLCGQVGHPASYRGCPKIKEMVKNKKEVQAISSSKNSKTFDSKFVEKNVSFASMAKSSNVRKTSDINNLLNSVAEETFGCNYFELKRAFDSFLSIYNNEKDPRIRKEALLNFILKTDYNG